MELKRQTKILSREKLGPHKLPLFMGLGPKISIVFLAMKLGSLLPRISFCLLLIAGFMACGSNQGTEVTNPINPSETPKKEVAIPAVDVELVIQVADGWAYLLYEGATQPGPEAFNDPVPGSIQAASFIKTSKAFFTVFTGRLEIGDTLTDYITPRRTGVGNLQLETLTDDNGNIAEAAFFYPESSGPRGGFFFDLYLAVGRDVLWMRAELLGSDSERGQSWNEFGEMINTMQLKEKEPK